MTDDDKPCLSRSCTYFRSQQLQWGDSFESEVCLLHLPRAHQLPRLLGKAAVSCPVYPFWGLVWQQISLLDNGTRNNKYSVLQPFLSSSYYQSSGLLLINHHFCGLIQISLDASNTLLSVTSSTVFVGFFGVDIALQPLLYYFFLLLSDCDSYFIHNSRGVCVTNLSMLASKPY